jgi:hypothetical protein
VKDLIEKKLVGVLGFGMDRSTVNNSWHGLVMLLPILFHGRRSRAPAVKINEMPGNAFGRGISDFFDEQKFKS